MTTVRQMTPEEEAYERLLDDETWETLSWPAQTLFRLADYLAYVACMVPNVIVDDRTIDVGMAKMSFVAGGLTDRDQELLTEIVNAARTAADSLDLEDHETLTGYRVGLAELHAWHRFTADLVERELREEGARRRVPDVDWWTAGMFGFTGADLAAYEDPEKHVPVDALPSSWIVEKEEE